MSILKQGLPLYLWWQNVLSIHCSKVYISCSKAQTEKYSILHPLVDKIENQGPLSGLVEAIKLHKSSSIILVPVDLCYVTPENISYLLEHHKNYYDATVFMTKGPSEIYPLFGILEPVIFPKLLLEFENTRKSILSVLQTSNLNRLKYNINLNDLNTPEAYSQFLLISKNQ